MHRARVFGSRTWRRCVRAERKWLKTFGRVSGVTGRAMLSAYWVFREIALGVGLELSQTAWVAEVILLAVVGGRAGGMIRVDGHAADRIDVPHVRRLLELMGQPTDHILGYYVRRVPLDEMASFGNGDEREVLLNPLPGVVESARQKIYVLEAVDHQDRALYFGQLAIGLVWRAGIVGLVVVQHPFHRGAAERLEVLLADLGILSEYKHLGLQFASGIGFLKLARVLAVLVLLGVFLGEFSHQTIWVRQVTYDEAVGLFRMNHGETPRDSTPPIVADDHSLVPLEVIDDR